MEASRGGAPHHNTEPAVYLRCALCCERKGLHPESTCQGCFASARQACSKCTLAGTSTPGTTAAHPQQHVHLPNQDLCVDALVAAAVTAVNKAGLHTADSCQGWPQQPTGTLTFEHVEDATRLMCALATRLPDLTWIRANLRAASTGGHGTVLYTDLAVPPDLWPTVEQTANEL